MGVLGVMGGVEDFFWSIFSVNYFVVWFIYSNFVGVD